MEELELVKKQILVFVQDLGHKKSVQLLQLMSSGKMLRSKLVFKIAQVNQKSIKLCAVIEMIQAASLLHDDVIDESTTRRGQPSINAIFDNKTSIMFGDVLYSKAFNELTKMDNKIAHHISNSVTLLSIGEILDVDLAREFNISYDNYLDMIYKKTASLIEASARCAAILANKNEDTYALYGKNLGIAFQMVDDILDITQDSTTLGKPSMFDFVDGKVTIPYLLLWEKLDIQDKEKLKNMYKKKLNTQEISWIKTSLKNTNALNDSIKLINQYGSEAIKAIEYDQNSELVDIMNSMINRTF
jgi:octaprenyl-diphosphate synthase